MDYNKIYNEELISLVKEKIKQSDNSNNLNPI